MYSIVQEWNYELQSQEIKKKYEHFYKLIPMAFIKVSFPLCWNRLV